MFNWVSWIMCGMRNCQLQNGSHNIVLYMCRMQVLALTTKVFGSLTCLACCVFVFKGNSHSLSKLSLVMCLFWECCFSLHASEIGFVDCLVPCTWLQGLFRPHLEGWVWHFSLRILPLLPFPCYLFHQCTRRHIQNLVYIIRKEFILQR